MSEFSDRYNVTSGSMSSSTRESPMSTSSTTMRTTRIRRTLLAPRPLFPIFYMFLWKILM